MDDKIKYLEKYLPSERFEEGIKKLESGSPVQYIVGNVDFMGYVINVDNRVLIPRFETELLVEKAINYISKKFNTVSDLNILDIGTGSGCISIALKKKLGCNVVACDISRDALSLASENATINNVDINFVESDVFSNIKGRFDVIISNPPYIRYDEVIEDVVKNNEPHIALFADNNGLYFYDKILRECSNYLNENYVICFEIGELQALDIKNLVYKYLGNVLIFVEEDYSNRNRFIFVVK